MYPHRKQLTLFLVLLSVNALLAFLSYTLLPLDQLAAGAEAVTPEMAAIPAWQFGLANAGLVLFLYGLLGLGGYFLARRLGLPGIYREGAGWRAWVLVPLLVGLISGVAIVLIDQLFARGDWTGFTHPPFPLSLIASATAGIGEEVLFRLFVMSLWAFLLNLLFRRWNATPTALWAANLIAALAFTAGHLPAAMFLLGAATPVELPPLVMGELLLLNGFLGLVAGERFMKEGLVAAVGVHFWADIVWHVLWPLMGG